MPEIPSTPKANIYLWCDRYRSGSDRRSFSINPQEMVEDLGFTLATAHFQPCSVIIFGMYMMHSTTSNLTDRYRISIDTHYQLAGEAKGERFFFGPDSTWPGNFYNLGATYTPTAELRKQWGCD